VADLQVVIVVLILNQVFSGTIGKKTEQSVTRWNVNHLRTGLNNLQQGRNVNNMTE